MKQYYIVYNRNTNIVLALIAPPLLIVPFIYIMAKYFPDLPEWAMFTIIFALIGAIVLFVFYIIKRISPKALLTLNDDGFIVEFEHKDLFTPSSFELKTKNIRNFFSDGNQAGFYMSFSTDVRPSSFNLSAGSKSEEDQDEFADLIVAITAMVNERNEKIEVADEEPPITNITIYQRGWVKAILILSGIVMAITIAFNVILPFVDNPGLLKVVLILCAGLFIVYKVVRRYRKKNQHNS